MNSDGICYKEQLTFLKYINANYLFYSITILAFASVFFLTWILSKYTFFEKQKIPRGKLPKFPYGNFRDVIKQETSLHVFIWKNFLRFKKRGCKFGGLFLFMRPVVILVEDDLRIKEQPEKSLIDLNKKVLNNFVNNFACTIKAPLQDKLEKNQDALFVLKEFLLESTCLLFGFQPNKIVEDINKLLKDKYKSTFKYYLYLTVFKNIDNEVYNQKVLLDIINQRKKNDLREHDLIDLFIKSYNESKLEDITREIFNLFANILSYSSSTLLFCLYELANNEEIRGEVIGEIRRFTKKNTTITSENLDELNYLEAVVKETLRKYPPVATEISNRNLQNQNFLTFKSILALHRNSQNYIKPEAFDPDRFASEQLFKPGIFLPFGSSTENAHLYMELVSLQVILVMTSIFSTLDVKMKEGVTDNFKFNTKLLYLSPCEDLNLVFRKIS
ncbi:unnamed protein product [Ceutorhynchus assimilis]|uniref:Cytochrome P450 n=1 Tax=Ceutorhynchus assimilis TaxID=467358 RepID=A0A9N9MQ90_9CUCU|nr:unnamed protein product [Ceutorhynchus assimilis]